MLKPSFAPPPTGAFTFDYRQAMLRDTWSTDAAGRAIPLTAPLRLEALLTTSVEVAQWAGEGLPGDELSVQNGLLTTRANRWPLCIDPQVRWEARALQGRCMYSLQLADTLLLGCANFVNNQLLPFHRCKPSAGSRIARARRWMGR